MALKNLRFTINPNDIRVLTSPKEFYESLIYMFQNAKSRAVISTLYIGTGKYTSNVINTLSTTLKSLPKGQLKVDILIDKLRGTRVESTTSPMSSVSQVLPLFETSQDNIRISLFHNPLLNWWLNSILPERINELIGVMHIKAFISDNTLLISGANLNDSYLVDRQDRYMIIEDVELCNAIHNIINCIQNFSYSLNSDSSLSWNGDVPDPLTNAALFRKNFSVGLKNTLHKIRQNDNTAKKLLQDCTNFQNSTRTSQPNPTEQNILLSQTTQTANPKQYTQSKQEVLQTTQLNTSSQVIKPTESNQSNFPTHLEPLTQLNQPIQTKQPTQSEQLNEPKQSTDTEIPSVHTKSLNNSSFCTVEICLQAGFTNPPIMDEFNLISHIFKQANQKNQPLVIASGYLNLPQFYLQQLRAKQQHPHDIPSDEAKPQLVLITAAPGANSFFQSKGPSYYIPAAYACVAQISLDTIGKNNDKWVNLYEYCRENWTFHSKGIWVYPSKSCLTFHTNSSENSDTGQHQESSDSTTTLPVLTFIGSSNYGERAIWRDLELSYLIHTDDTKLQESFHSEIVNVIPSCHLVRSQDLKNRYSLWLQWFVKYFGKWFL